MKDLKALFWKEWHENIRWAILAALALSGSLVYTWYHLLQKSSLPDLGQVWSSENLIFSIAMPLIGLMLGLLQILPELRRDQWAFLIHRPASRTTLFFGKVIPGVCLYLLATILPLLGLAAWAAQPSHVAAPFDFRFTLAGWAAILSGLPFYFAGLLVALRPARWYGSRALPLLTAAIAPWAAVAVEFNEFWQVGLTCVFVTALLLCAAWGSFLTNGQYQEQTKPARFALGLTLYPAVIAVGIGVLMLLVGLVNMVNSAGSPRNQEAWQNNEWIDTQGRFFDSSVHVDKQGHSSTTITDQAGKLVDTHLWINLIQHYKIFSLNYLSLGGPNWHYSRYSDPSCYVVSLTSSGDDRHQTNWYYEIASRQIIGYGVRETAGDPASAKFLSIRGYLGPHGFSQDRKQAGLFEAAQPDPVGFYGFHLLRFPAALYLFDPYAPVPAITLLQTLPGGNGGTTLLAQTGTNGEATAQQALIVTSGQQATAYVPSTANSPQKPTRLFTVPLMFDPKTDSNIQVAVTPDGSRFFFLSESASRSGTDRLVMVASDGRIIKSETLPAKHGIYLPSNLHFIDAAPTLLVPPAIITYAVVYGYIGDRLHWSTASGLWNTVSEGFGAILSFTMLGGLFSALLGWRISLRCGDGWRGQIAWALGVFWLGGYGVLLLLALRAWPARVPCPNCGRLRVVSRSACEHCGAAFARPRQDGTEIFDAGETAVPNLTR